MTKVGTAKNETKEVDERGTGDKVVLDKLY
jgi:hypothetical protein